MGQGPWIMEVVGKVVGGHRCTCALAAPAVPAPGCECSAGIPLLCMYLSGSPCPSHLLQESQSLPGESRRHHWCPAAKERGSPGLAGPAEQPTQSGLRYRQRQTRRGSGAGQHTQVMSAGLAAVYRHTGSMQRERQCGFAGKPSLTKPASKACWASDTSCEVRSKASKATSGDTVPACASLRRVAGSGDAAPARAGPAVAHKSRTTPRSEGSTVVPLLAMASMVAAAICSMHGPCGESGFPLAFPSIEAHCNRPGSHYFPSPASHVHG